MSIRAEQDKEPEPETVSEAAGPGPSDDSSADGMPSVKTGGCILFICILLFLL